jgi:cell division protein FtsB
MKEKKREGKRERPIVLTLYVLFWATIIIMFSGLFISQAGEYNELNAELTRIEAEVARANAELTNMQVQNAMFDSDLYIEELARNRGMARPYEIVFRNMADSEE